METNLPKLGAWLEGTVGKVFRDGRQISSIIRKNTGRGFRTTSDDKVLLTSLHNEKDKMQ